MKNTTSSTPSTSTAVMASLLGTDMHDTMDVDASQEEVLIVTPEVEKEKSSAVLEFQRRVAMVAQKAKQQQQQQQRQQQQNKSSKTESTATTTAKKASSSSSPTTKTTKQNTVTFAPTHTTLPPTPPRETHVSPHSKPTTPSKDKTTTSTQVKTIPTAQPLRFEELSFPIDTSDGSSFPSNPYKPAPLRFDFSESGATSSSTAYDALGDALPMVLANPKTSSTEDKGKGKTKASTGTTTGAHPNGIHASIHAPKSTGTKASPKLPVRFTEEAIAADEAQQQGFEDVSAHIRLDQAWGAFSPTQPDPNDADAAAAAGTAVSTTTLPNTVTGAWVCIPNQYYLKYGNSLPDARHPLFNDLIDERIQTLEYMVHRQEACLRDTRAYLRFLRGLCHLHSELETSSPGL